MTAARAGPASVVSSPSAETTAVFLAFRNALALKFKTPVDDDDNRSAATRLEDEAFDFLLGSVNAGVERAAVLSALKNQDLRPALGGGALSHENPVLLRVYLDARRGFCPPPTTTRHDDKTSPHQLATRATLRLVGSPKDFVQAAGTAYRTCESLDASDVLVAMRRFAPGIPNVTNLSLAQTRAFLKTWDSATNVYKKRDAWYAHDFNRFARFADSHKDAKEGACDGWFDGECFAKSGEKNFCTLNLDTRGGVTDDGARGENTPSFPGRLTPAQRKAGEAAERVRQQAFVRVEAKLQSAWHRARHTRVEREGDALVECLSLEMGVYAAQRAPGVGGVDATHAFAVVHEKGNGCVGRLTPEPTLALALAAMDTGSTGFVTPSEAKLAFAQCSVCLTGIETFVLGDRLARRGERSSRTKWHVHELLDTLRCDRLPGDMGSAEVVRLWTASATTAIESGYLNPTSGNNTAVDLLRYLAAPAYLAFGDDAIVKVIDACLNKFRTLTRTLAALDNELDVASGGGAGEGAVSTTNVVYAARVANVHSPSTTSPNRLQTLARFFPPASEKQFTARETGLREKRIDWRALLDACGPITALLEQEKTAGASPGSVASLKLARLFVLNEQRGGPESGGTPDLDANTIVVDCDDVSFDDDIDAVCASIAKRLFHRVCSLRETLESADARDLRYLPVDDFARAVAAAGFGPHTFGPASDAKWALAACHHPYIENAVLYPKFMAMVVVGIEREVFRRSDAAGAMARARQTALAETDAQRKAWAFDTMRVATEAADAAMAEATARLRNEHTAERRRDADVARRDAVYRARAAF